MIIKIPNGELRDELPYALRFSYLGENEMVDDPYLTTGGYPYFKEHCSFRCKLIQIVTQCVTSVDLVTLPHETEPKVLGRWIASKTMDFNVNDINLMPGQWFNLKVLKHDLFNDYGVTIILNGLLRRPVEHK